MGAPVGDYAPERRGGVPREDGDGGKALFVQWLSEPGLGLSGASHGGRAFVFCAGCVCSRPRVRRVRVGSESYWPCVLESFPTALFLSSLPVYGIAT